MATSFLIDLEDVPAARLRDFAALRDTTPEALLAEAATALIARSGAYEAWVAEGEADAEAGRTLPLEQVMDELDTLIERGGQSTD